MGIAVHIKGIVQGVGFRPHVWKLASALGLKGFVRNDAGGVYIEAEGGDTRQLIALLKSEPPPLSHITSLETAEIPPRGFTEFRIAESDATADKSVQISPDIAVCADCTRELSDRNDRRYRYPFINCVNCGPRYSIIRALPYDRPNTSMADFGMCPDCARQYGDPADRRYHAQPVACPACGPKLWFHERENESWEMVWIESIKAGKIVAVKGIGGFHLACDALNAAAVAELRRRKARENKPFALMVPDLGWVRGVCELSAAEEELLTSRERPIVLLRIKAGFETRAGIAPNLNTLGVILPYTPMHLRMFDRLPCPLVMTSANYTDEPMIYTNAGALKKLAGVADEFLLHDRDIVNRCDDSVAAVYGSRRGPPKSGQTVVLRPGRGLAPFSLPFEAPRTALAIGADMKNTFAVAHGGRITLSPYIGDLENPETQEILKTNVRRYLDCYEVKPGIVVHDLHPDYFSTRIAKEFAAELGVPHVAVQHHYAHCLAAAAEHGIKGRAIGVAFDGTGYGADSTVWGGEILEFDANGFERIFHLRPFALPSGQKAVQEPKRTLISILSHVEAMSSPRFKGDKDIVSTLKILASGINCPFTSSMGRLFDAAAVLLGACDRPTFDGEAPMRLEALADPEEQGILPFEINGNEIDWRPLLRDILDQQSTVGSRRLSARFHNTIVQMIFECLHLLNALLPVVFAGGVFQNRFLVERIKSHSAFNERRMFFSSYPNDSAIALGQAAFGATNYK